MLTPNHRHPIEQTSGPLRRCIAVRHAQGGTAAEHQRRRTQHGENFVKLSEKPAGIMVSADRQPAGHEAVWQQKGAGQGAHPPENRRPLGDPSVQLVQVCMRN